MDEKEDQSSPPCSPDRGSESRRSTRACGSSPASTMISDRSTWSRNPATHRQPLGPEVVTHVSGTFRHPCLSGRTMKRLAPRVGFEPTTNRLTAGCSTAELPRNSRCLASAGPLSRKRQREPVPCATRGQLPVSPPLAAPEVRCAALAARGKLETTPGIEPGCADLWSHTKRVISMDSRQIGRRQINGLRHFRKTIGAACEAAVACG